ncbi:MAG TPA: acyloxyacyl hydrolase [Burkholderiales bacterium]|nr:acyloxyacyl hydrolase [Burkholderiales bacterium]
MRAALLAVALIICAPQAFAEPELAAFFGRATGGKDVDIVRLAYRKGPLQVGASAWWVPDIRGKTRRYDLNASAIWRAERAWGYLEAGFGPYLLSRTVNNRTTSLPSELQFGSHVGAGLRLGRTTLGLAFQHLSNAGIKQPNGGIDFVQLTLGYAL